MTLPAHLAGLLLILGASGLLGCSDDNSVAGPPGSGGVSVRDNFFTPTPSSITTGTTVTWTWRGNNRHSVTFDPADSPTSPIQVTGSYSRQFSTPGTFTYYCTVHGRAMSGSVVVQ